MKNFEKNFYQGSYVFNVLYFLYIVCISFVIPYFSVVVLQMTELQMTDYNLHDRISVININLAINGGGLF